VGRYWRINAKALPETLMFIAEPESPFPPHGDYSKYAQAHFIDWALANGYKELAKGGIPKERKRDWNTYYFLKYFLEVMPEYFAEMVPHQYRERFYLFGSHPLCGSYNWSSAGGHLGNWYPPAIQKRGFRIAVEHLGQGPAIQKVFNEAAASVRESGGEPGPYCQTFGGVGGVIYGSPAEVKIEAMTALSALPEGIMMLGDAILPPSLSRESSVSEEESKAYWKNITELTGLSHALSGMKRNSNVYVYLPMSAFFNDFVANLEKKPLSEMVSLNCESKNLYPLFILLNHHNIDYRITYELKIPENSLVLYSALRPVFTPAEWKRIKQFVKNGGIFLYASAREPELPDGTRIADFTEFVGAKVNTKTPNSLIKLNAEPISLAGKGKSFLMRKKQGKGYFYWMADTFLLNKNAVVLSPEERPKPNDRRQAFINLSWKKVLGAHLSSELSAKIIKQLIAEHKIENNPPLGKGEIGCGGGDKYVRPRRWSGVKSYSYLKDGIPVYLLVNQDLDRKIEVTLPFDVSDCFTREFYKKGVKICVDPADYRLLQKGKWKDLGISRSRRPKND